MKLAIIDIDGVIANSDTRFAQATTDGKINWRIECNPDLVTLDTPIDGTRNSIQQFMVADYTLLYLTSRPEHMVI